MLVELAEERLENARTAQTRVIGNLKKLKGVSAGQKFGSTSGLFSVIKVTGYIGRTELESVFDAGKRRLGECIEMKDQCAT
jgi:hypothetical protein